MQRVSVALPKLSICPNLEYISAVVFVTRVLSRRRKVFCRSAARRRKRTTRRPSPRNLTRTVVPVMICPHSLTATNLGTRAARSTIRPAAKATPPRSLTTVSPATAAFYIHDLTPLSSKKAKVITRMSQMRLSSTMASKVAMTLTAPVENLSVLHLSLPPV